MGNADVTREYETFGGSTSESMSATRTVHLSKRPRRTSITRPMTRALGPPIIVVQ
jgi:hypothetical protein